MIEDTLEYLEKTLDVEGMCEFTRSFVDDLDSAMSSLIEQVTSVID